MDGHKWLMLRVNQLKHEHMAEFHHLAGLDLDCERCGLEWRDAYDRSSKPEHIEIVPEKFRRLMQIRGTFTKV